MNSSEETQEDTKQETISIELNAKELNKIKEFLKINTKSITFFYIKDGSLIISFGDIFHEKNAILETESIKDFSEYSFGVSTSTLFSNLSILDRDISKLSRSPVDHVTIESNQNVMIFTSKLFKFALKVENYKKTQKIKTHVMAEDVNAGDVKKYLIVNRPEDLERMGPEVIKSHKLD